MDSPATSISCSGKSVEGYQIYEGTHERSVKRMGRTYGEHVFDQYIGRNEYTAYYKDGDPYIIFEGSGKIIKGALKVLQREYPDLIELKQGEVDFNYLRKQCDNIWGGWFNQNQPRLRKVALFGDHVDLTQDYNSLQALGSLSSLCVELTNEGNKHCLMICKQRTIVFYDSDVHIAEDLRRLELLIPFLYGKENIFENGAAATSE